MWLRTLIIDLAIIVAAFIVLPLPFSILVIGTRQHALAILGHDGAHGHATQWMTRLVFWSIGVNLERYRAFHFDHHKYLGTDRDPETPFRNDDWNKFAWRNVGRDLAGLSALEMGRIWRTAGGSYAIIGVVIAVFTLISPTFALTWVAALATSFVACFRQRSIIEHGEAYSFGRLHKLILFPHNCWRHAEHHANPALSFDQLNRDLTTGAT